MKVKKREAYLYKGVSFDAKSGLFESSILLNGFKLVLGHFDTPLDASVAYQKALEGRSVGAYDAFDDAYNEYISKIEALAYVDVPPNEVFIQSTSRDFCEWIESKLVLDVRLYKTTMYDLFIHENPSSWDVTKRRFSFWLDKYVWFKGYVSIKGRDATGRWVHISKK